MRSLQIGHIQNPPHLPQTVVTVKLCNQKLVGILTKILHFRVDIMPSQQKLGTILQNEKSENWSHPKSTTFAANCRHS